MWHHDVSQTNVHSTGTLKSCVCNGLMVCIRLVGNPIVVELLSVSLIVNSFNLLHLLHVVASSLF